MNYSKSLLTLMALAPATLVAADFTGFINHGLVGVGRLSANSLDQTGQDTLGGVFSSLVVETGTIQESGGTFTGKLYGLPDRGFGDGAQDYHARIQTFDFSFTPASGAGPFPQTQINFSNTGTKILKDSQGNPFTGFNPDSTFTAFPKSAPGSLGGGKFSLDAEGLVKLPNGDWMISDEYGPNVYRFDSSGKLLATLPLPASFVPEQPAGTVNFDANIANASGRRGNRGMEGLSVSPDGNTLFAMLQSPLMQDGGASNSSIYTRILQYDLTPGAATEGQLTGEFIYQLAVANGRHTPQSEILALNDHQLLVLERDNRGLGGSAGASAYKYVNVVELNGASNVLGLAYDLGVGDPGQVNLPINGALPPGINAAEKLEFVNMLNLTELTQFGLNADASRNSNSLAEKWEGLGLFPATDTPEADDFYLFVGNDNDFTASTVIHNGQVVGTTTTQVDMMLLAYRVSLPGASAQPVPEASSGLAIGVLALLAGSRWRQRHQS
ncbi:MAG: esterase-like activity of phytase family protein [Verrucomicrobia bacterium]|nr:esterase-like activity of phytase family protein [Verrucomicrobiota bacterium]